MALQRCLALVLFAAMALGSPAAALALSRAELVVQVSDGAVSADGQAVEADGLRYVPDPGGHTIPDLPGWRPVAPVSPEHFGALGDGSDETAALAAAFAFGNVRLLPDRVYGFTRLEVPEGSVVAASGALLRYLGEDTRTPILEIGADTSWDTLTYSAGAQTVRGKSSIRIRDGVIVGMIDATADRQLDANLVHVMGDDVEIGHMRTRGFGRPLLVEHPKRILKDFRLGWHDFESIVRGIRMRKVTRFEVGGGRQAGRSPLGLNENPGRNNILLSGVRKGTFGPMDLADAPEHAVRFGGGGNASGLSSEDVVFAPITIRRASASAIKINPGPEGRVRNVRFADVTIIDPFWEIGTSAKASHLIRISHADDIRIAGGSVRREATDPVMTDPGTIFAIADSTNVDIGPFAVECCASRLVAFLEQNDSDRMEQFGNIREIRFRGLDDLTPEGMSDAPIRFKTCDISVEEITFEGLNLRQLRKRDLIDFPKCKARVRAIRLQGRVDAVDRSILDGLPEDADFTVDLEDPDGRRMKGSQKEIRGSLSR